MEITEKQGKLVPATGNSSTYFPGLSHESSSSLTSWMTATMNARVTGLPQQIHDTNTRLDRLSQTMERFIGNFKTNQPENSHFPSIQNPRHDLPQPHLQSNQQSNPSSQSSPHNEQISPTNDTVTTRWRGEKLGTFDPAVDDVYTFTNRMHQVAELRGHLLVQLNVSLQLRACQGLVRSGARS